MNRLGVDDQLTREAKRRATAMCFAIAALWIMLGRARVLT
jgi:hypothetical protein